MEYLTKKKRFWNPIFFSPTFQFCIMQWTELQEYHISLLKYRRILWLSIFDLFFVGDKFHSILNFLAFFFNFSTKLLQVQAKKKKLKNWDFQSVPSQQKSIIIKWKNLYSRLFSFQKHFLFYNNCCHLLTLTRESTKIEHFYLVFSYFQIFKTVSL